MKVPVQVKASYHKIEMNGSRSRSRDVIGSTSQR